MKSDMEKRKTLLVDCSYIERHWSSSSALVIYAVRLIQGFLEYGSTRICVLVWKDKEEMMDNLIGREYDKIVLDRNDLFTQWRPFYRLTGILPAQLRKGITDRYISTVLLPYNNGVVFFYPKGIRHYAVVHDVFLLDRLREKKGAIRFSLLNLYLKYLLRKFTALISISEFTQRDLLQREGVESEVAHNSISFDFSVAEMPISSLLEKKYILDINRYERYKNAETLIRAFNLLKDMIPHLLYLKGGRDSVEDRLLLEHLVAKLGLIDRVVFDMEVRTEGEMRYLYSHADLVVSPSLKEGFGWTPIEGAILQVPVLVSDIEVFKEVTCGKISTFDPHSSEDLAKHILAILKNPPSKKVRKDLAKFFLNKYSLKNLIERFEEIMGFDDYKADYSN